MYKERRNTEQEREKRNTEKREQILRERRNTEKRKKEEKEGKISLSVREGGKQTKWQYRKTNSKKCHTKILDNPNMGQSSTTHDDTSSSLFGTREREREREREIEREKHISFLHFFRPFFPFSLLSHIFSFIHCLPFSHSLLFLSPWFKYISSYRKRKKHIFLSLNVTYLCN